MKVGSRDTTGVRGRNTSWSSAGCLLQHSGNTRRPTFCGSQMDHWLRWHNLILAPRSRTPSSLIYWVHPLVITAWINYFPSCYKMMVLSFSPSFHMRQAAFFCLMLRRQRTPLIHKSCSEQRVAVSKTHIHTYKISFLEHGNNSEDSAFSSESKSEREILKIISPGGIVSISTCLSKVRDHLGI